jgi:hypothetical protein
MKISDLIPEAKRLIKLGARRQKPDPAIAFFSLPAQTKKLRTPIKPDVDYHPDAEREPQAPSYAGMWIDHFANIGNIKNPLGSPME